jgi:methionine-rich copper-binding protein CopC
LLLLVVPGGASAHANPDRAEPKVGSTVSASPDQVRIWFDSDLEPAFSSIEVHAQDGAKMDHGHGHVDASDPKLLEVAVPRLAPGRYRVIWSVMARDGHRTAGDYRFTVK